MKISGTLNYRVLKGMALIASRDETRPQLERIQVRRVAGETYWIATDGRRLGILHDSGQLELYPKPDEYGDITFELPVPKFALFGLRDKEGRNTLRFDMDTEAVPEHEEESPKYKTKRIVPVSGWRFTSRSGSPTAKALRTLAQFRCITHGFWMSLGRWSKPHGRILPTAITVWRSTMSITSNQCSAVKCIV